MENYATYSLSYVYYNELHLLSRKVVACILPPLVTNQLEVRQTYNSKTKNQEQYQQPSPLENKKQSPPYIERLEEIKTLT